MACNLLMLCIMRHHRCILLTAPLTRFNEETCPRQVRQLRYITWIRKALLLRSLQARIGARCCSIRERWLLPPDGYAPPDSRLPDAATRIEPDAVTSFGGVHVIGSGAVLVFEQERALGDEDLGEVRASGTGDERRGCLPTTAPVRTPFHLQGLPGAAGCPDLGEIRGERSPVPSDGSEARKSLKHHPDFGLDFGLGFGLSTGFFMAELCEVSWLSKLNLERMVCTSLPSGIRIV
jgi:hypothetical protein